MNNVVIAIPYWEVDLGKRELLEKCVTSMKGYDKMIILHGKQPTLISAWNQLLKLGFSMGASHVVLTNDDLTLTKGLVSDLCTDAVQLPLVNNSVYKVFHGHMMAIPRKVYEEIGEFDPVFQHYWSDTDYAMRLKKAKVPTFINSEVWVSHPDPGRTLKYTRTQAEDEAAFVKKWGKPVFDPFTDDSII